MEIAIALVQLEIAPGEPLKNLARMDRFVRDAKKRGADLVVFPEDAVCGPLDGQVAFVAHAAEYLVHFQQLAMKHAIDIVPGSWTGEENGLLYNQAHYINADGSIAGAYRKINLWETEKTRLAPGTLASVFPTRWGRVGLIICWDISFPAMFAAMVAQGVELVIAPTYWSFTKPADQVDEVVDDEILLIDSLCTTRAFENNILLAYCNAAGELSIPGGGDTVLSGRSQITHPLEKVVCKAEGNKEEMLLARVHLAPAPTLAPA
ncbi:MAG: carbon-nitrogen hydrolase family protein [Flavobacteriales bacterium]